jgi:hypothetical protein
MRRFIKEDTRSSQPRVWDIWVKENRVYTQWGQLNGELNVTVEEHDGVNIGKKNEKSPGQVAEEKAEVKILSKVRGGYYEVNPKTNERLEASSESGMNFIEPLKGTRLYKPQREPTAALKKKMLCGKAVFTRKLDGMNHPVLINADGRPKMYSANFLPTHKDEVGESVWLDRYPQIEAELEALNLPPKTLLLGELHTCVHTSPKYQDKTGFGIDDFNHVGAVVKSLTDRAVKLQQEGGWLGYCIYDIAYLDGEYLLDKLTNTERWKYLQARLSSRETFRYLSMPDVLGFNQGSDWFMVSSMNGVYLELNFDDPDNPIDGLLGYARNLGWEGYVVRDPDAHCEDRGIAFGGTHERPASICKIKPKREGDFIVRWNPAEGIGEWGRGRKAGGVGSAMAYVWDGEKEVEVGKVGGGLSDKEVFEFADPTKYPMVWEVEFTDWTPKGKLREPRFKRVRLDKQPCECQEPIGGQKAG